MNRRKFLSAGLTAATGIFLPSMHVSRAESSPERELIFCLDWSGSMYDLNKELRTQNYLIQKEGHIAAIKDPNISEFLARGVWVQVILWSGSETETYPIFNSLIASKVDVERLVETLRLKVPHNPSPSGGTQHYTPLNYIMGTKKIGKKRIVDISTDEDISNYSGSRSMLLRGIIYKQNTAINVIAIGLGKKETDSLSSCLQTPDGFTVAVNSWGEYIPALKKKILRELNII